jgi:hypothetical protein
MVPTSLFLKRDKTYWWTYISLSFSLSTDHAREVKSTTYLQKQVLMSGNRTVLSTFRTEIAQKSYKWNVLTVCSVCTFYISMRGLRGSPEVPHLHQVRQNFTKNGRTPPAPALTKYQ